MSSLGRFRPLVRTLPALALLAAACGGAGPDDSADSDDVDESTTASEDAGTTAGDAPTDEATEESAATGDEPYDIVLSNDSLGNDWRVQMPNPAEAAVELEPLAGRVNLDIVNSETTVPAQIASLSNIISDEPDAILVDASSPDALNPTLQRACEQDIDGSVR